MRWGRTIIWLWTHLPFLFFPFGGEERKANALESSLRTTEMWVHSIGDFAWSRWDCYDLQVNNAKCLLQLSAIYVLIGKYLHSYTQLYIWKWFPRHEENYENEEEKKKNSWNLLDCNSSLSIKGNKLPVLKTEPLHNQKRWLLHAASSVLNWRKCLLPEGAGYSRSWRQTPCAHQERDWHRQFTSPKYQTSEAGNTFGQLYPHHEHVRGQRLYTPLPVAVSAQWQPPPGDNCCKAASYWSLPYKPLLRQSCRVWKKCLELTCCPSCKARTTYLWIGIRKIELV